MVRVPASAIVEETSFGFATPTAGVQHAAAAPLALSQLLRFRITGAARSPHYEKGYQYTISNTLFVLVVLFSFSLLTAAT